MKRILTGGQMLRWRHLYLTVTLVKATVPAYLVRILALPFMLQADECPPPRPTRDDNVRGS